jgi:hypothetical protein
MTERVLAERVPRRREPRPTIPQLRERIAGGANIHDVIGSVLEADTRIIRALSSIGVRVDESLAKSPADEAMVGLYALPPDKLSRGFADGFNFVTAHLYSLVVDVSQGIQKVPARAGEAVKDSFEEKRIQFVQDVSKKTSLIEPDPQELLASLGKDRSGATWLRARVQEEYQDSEVELDDVQRAELVAGAESAILGAERLYRELIPIPDS